MTILEGKQILCKAFYYKNYDFNLQTGVLSLNYGVDCIHNFTETITFPGAPFHLTGQQSEALTQVLFLTHIAFGVSYYKAFLPPELILNSGSLTASEAAFFDNFYLSGLGEFSVKNKVDLDIHFPFNAAVKRASVILPFDDKTLVPVGGGKDSCVTIELLKNMDKNITAVSVGNPRPIKECVAVSGMDHLVISRQISPDLLHLNETGTVYNGHVPITGLIAFLLWISGILYGHRYVAMSCEKSANVGNMKTKDRLINHQYSKSLEFEQDFYTLTKTITPAFVYFSLLRPLSEIHIAKLFAQHCSAYFDVFTSCNKAFKLDETKRLDRWCGTCDKCRFVFLMLAVFMDKEKLLALIGTNPLDDKTQMHGYEELLGLSGHKPFECVGEVEECRYALIQLAQNSTWKNDFIVKELGNKISQDEGDIFNSSSFNLIPEGFKNVMDRFTK